MQFNKLECVEKRVNNLRRKFDLFQIVRFRDRVNFIVINYRCLKKRLQPCINTKIHTTAIEKIQVKADKSKKSKIALERV